MSKFGSKVRQALVALVAFILMISLGKVPKVWADGPQQMTTTLAIHPTTAPYVTQYQKDQPEIVTFLAKMAQINAGQLPHAPIAYVATGTHTYRLVAQPLSQWSERYGRELHAWGLALITRDQVQVDYNNGACNNNSSTSPEALAASTRIAYNVADRALVEGRQNTPALVPDLEKRAADARTARDTRERELQACRLRYTQISQALQRANVEVDRTQKLALASMVPYGAFLVTMRKKIAFMNGLAAYLQANPDPPEPTFASPATAR